MRHRKSGRKLGRNSAHRKAMFRNMVTSLFEHGSIRTTDARAKELRSIADKLVTLGKRDTVHARRQAARTLRSADVLRKLFRSEMAATRALSSSVIGGEITPLCPSSS